jgi:hypothetical protein
MDAPKRVKALQESPGQWARVIWLDHEIRSGRFPPRRALQEEFSVSVRTAQEAVIVLPIPWMRP